MTAYLISVIDDDESVRESLPALVKAIGFAVCAFSSAEEFLASDRVALTSCLILDITMSGMTGPELQTELKRRQLDIPIIFITAQKDEAMRNELLGRGAIDCLFKPFGAVAMREALRRALGAG